jgi:tetratricopeptide (TPR) repeat protein
MMRFVPFALAVLLVAAQPAWSEDAPGPAPQDETAPSPDGNPALTPQSIGKLSLDQLFAELPAHAGSRAGKAIETEILKRFNQSGSDTVDLLYTWAIQAMEEKKYPLALDVLDQIVLIKPDFVEGWNKRATVYFLMDDYASSLADIRRTLALEPRHFGALSGLGMILDQTGQKEQAIVVFRRALAIDPQLDKIRETVEKLEKEVAGNSI